MLLVSLFIVKPHESCAIPKFSQLLKQRDWCGLRTSAYIGDNENGTYFYTKLFLIYMFSMGKQW